MMLFSQSVAVDPLEARRLAVELMQRRQPSIEPVQVADEPLRTGMQRIIEQMPVEARVVVPLAAPGRTRSP